MKRATPQKPQLSNNIIRIHNVLHALHFNIGRNPIVIQQVAKLQCYCKQNGKLTIGSSKCANCGCSDGKQLKINRQPSVTIKIIYKIQPKSIETTHWETHCTTWCELGGVWHATEVWQALCLLQACLTIWQFDVAEAKDFDGWQTSMDETMWINYMEKTMWINPWGSN